MDAFELPVTISPVHIHRENIQMYVPQIVGLPNAAVQRKINDTIHETAKAMLKRQGYGENPQTQITAYYEIKTNERGIVSLSLINYAFSGGAHGLTLQQSLTFEVRSGKFYKLSDLFKPDSGYERRINELIRRQIEQRKLPLLEPFTGITANQDFYIADKSLVVYFQLYDLMPYAYGFPYFPISVYDLEGFIKEDGPLGKMWS